MNVRSRLSWVTVIGLVGVAGLVGIFLYLLPSAADEFVRRESQRLLEQAAGRLPAEVEGLAAGTRRALERAAESEDVAALAEEDAPDAGALAAHVDLAQTLCRRFSLDNLVILDDSGLLLSAHPEAARIGLRDPERLDLARRASQRTMMAPGRKAGSDGGERAARPPLLSLATAVPSAGGRLRLLSSVPVSEADLEAAALRLGTDLVRTLRDPDGKSGEADSGERAVFLVGADGGRVATVVLRAPGPGGSVVRDLIVRHVLLVGVPWTFLFALAMVGIGWPKKNE